jgi:hypothetical protein
MQPHYSGRSQTFELDADEADLEAAATAIEESEREPLPPEAWDSLERLRERFRRQLFAPEAPSRSRWFLLPSGN